MDNRLTPRQRVQLRINAQRAAQLSTSAHEKERVLTPEEEEAETKRLWAEWEAAGATPEQLTRMKLEREAIAIMRKENPDVEIGHVWINPNPYPFPPEELEEMLSKLREYMNRKK